MGSEEGCKLDCNSVEITSANSEAADGPEMFVGPHSMWAGAKQLTVSTCNRDKESAKVLQTPLTCLPLNRMLFCKQTSTNFRTKKHQILVVAGLFINDINECLIICQKQDGTIFHVMTP